MKTGPQPQRWCTGPDPLLHQIHQAYRQQRNQALWRGEVWCIEFDQYVLMWGTLWPQRGRTAHSLCMVRLRYDQPWSVDNAEIVTRAQHARNGSGQRYGHAGSHQGPRGPNSRTLARRQAAAAESGSV